MAHVDTKALVVGDGPTGLQAALLLAKTQITVDVVGPNDTGVRKAHLRNYLGIPDGAGPAFMEEARRQAQAFGARLHAGRIASVERHGDGFLARTEQGETFQARFLLLAGGMREKSLAASLALAMDGENVKADHFCRTSLAGVFAGGSLTRGMKTQVATSVGDGAAMALEILALDRGKPTHDFDVMPPT
ncbi:MAG: FAD-dependent oxidoreductase [Thermoplasmatota archaeon]